ncbi:MAG: hypothetical protein ACYDEN_14940 [Acidimicrobiales bacterium]
MTPRWHLLVGPAEGEVRCGPNRHRLRWEAGELVAADHGDGDGEAVLAQLGGDEPECVALLRRWRDHAGDPLVLLLGGRHPGDALVIPADLLGRLRADLDRHGSSAELDRYAVLSLLALGPQLERRLPQEVAAHLAETGDLLPLEAATVGRLMPVLRRWGGGRSWDVSIGEPGAGGPARVTVGPQWLAEVWGSYLAVVAGHLVLDVLDAGEGGHARVRAVSAPGRPVRTITVRGPAPWRAVLDPRDGS